MLAGENGGTQLGQGGKEAGGVKVRGVYLIEGAWLINCPADTHLRTLIRLRFDGMHASGFRTTRCHVTA